MRIPKFQLKPFNYSVEWQVYDIPVVKSSIAIEPRYWGTCQRLFCFSLFSSSIGFAGEIVAFNGIHYFAL